MTAHARVICTSETTYAPEPYEVVKRDVQGRTSRGKIWPRDYLFSSVDDSDLPEDRRSNIELSSKITVEVKDPDISFQPGRQYVLVLAPADDAPET